MVRSRLLALAMLVTGCLPVARSGPPAPVTPASAPAPTPPAPAPTPAWSPAPDSLRAQQDSILDNALLAQLAESHAPGETPAQATDELETIAAGRGLDITTYADHPRVRYYVDFFRGPARSRMNVWLGRLPVYEPMIRSTFARYDIPSDLIYLGLIESGYSNLAVSRSRAVGMWQFMLATGKWMGLRVDGWVDERRDPVRATDAAARYLQQLANQFGSYYLAAAAYNGGPGAVSRGLGRLDLASARSADDAEGLPDDDLEYTDEHFFTLADSRYIHQETKDYVPKLLAAALVARDPLAYGFQPIPEGPPLPTDSLIVPEATGLDVIARLAEVSLDAIVALNPHYLRKVTPPGAAAVVRLPAGSMAQVAARYATLPAAERVDKAVLARLAAAEASSRRARTHTVRRGETLGGIANRYRVTQAQLRSWNRLPRSGMIRMGQKLKVSSGSAGPARGRSTVSAGTNTYMVRRGDTLSSIARRHGTSVQALQNLNRLSSPRAIKAGQRIKIPS